MYFGLNRTAISNCTGNNQLLKEIELDSILLESDAPFQFSVPWGIGPTIRRVAEIRNLSPRLIGLQTRINTSRLFGDGLFD